jgi:hypothetical protein
VLRSLRGRFGSGSSKSPPSIVWLLGVGGLRGLVGVTDWVVALVKKPDKVCCFFCVLVMVKAEMGGLVKLSELFRSSAGKTTLRVDEKTRLDGLAFINPQSYS